MKKIKIKKYVILVGLFSTIFPALPRDFFFPPRFLDIVSDIFKSREKPMRISKMSNKQRETQTSKPCFRTCFCKSVLERQL